MKKHYIIFFLLISISTFAQQKNRLALTYGIAANLMVTNENIDGNGSRDGKGASVIGLRYLRSLAGNLSLETGLEYSHFKFITAPALYPGSERITRKESINILSVPVFGNYVLWKYFFVNAGALLDLQINKKSDRQLDDQSGIGFGAGFGGKFQMKNISFTINPYLQKHAVIAFDKSQYQERILEPGIRFGVGYNF